MATLGEFLALHEKVRRQPDGQYKMLCRAHDDRNPSLSATQEDGKIIVHCFSGCSSEQIVAAVGLELKDLFIDNKSDGARAVRRGRSVTTTYEIKNHIGELIAIHERVQQADRKSFTWQRPNGESGLNGTPMAEIPLYGSELAAEWQLDQPIVVTEGEKAADAVRAAGLQAVGTVCGAASTPGDAALAVLIGTDAVLWPDADDAGRAHMERIAERIAPSVANLRVVDWPDAPAKGDAADATPERIRELVAAASTYVTPQSDGSLAETLDAVLAHLRRFIFFSDPAQAIAVTLWVAHTHAYDRAEASPILWVRSAAPESGKTRLFETIEHLVQRPWKAIRPSEAVLYRVTDRDHPTVLLDEIDAIFKDKSNQFEGLRAYLNAGNRRGVTVSRWNQARNDLDSFEVFTPKAIAGLGSIPDTVATRAIPIVMQRRAKGEPIERLRERKARELGHPLRDALAVHVRAIESLNLPEDALPDELGDRQQDSWEPLLAIANAAGGEWPEQARKASIVLHVGTDAVDEQDYGIRLLADTRVVFTKFGGGWLKTADLIDELAKIEESPWGDIRGKTVTPHYLSKLLRPFGIRPKMARHGGEKERGYEAEQFADAWQRYLPAYPSASGTSGTSGTGIRVPVPDVPDVPLTQGYGIEQLTIDEEAAA